MYRFFSHHPYGISKKRGITALELLAVIAIIGVIVVISIRPFQSFRDKQVIIATTERVVAALHEARTNTLASREASSFGVHFETQKAVVFQGEVYDPSDDTNEDIVFHPRIEVSAISLNDGGDTVIFERLTGAAISHGTITFALGDNASTTRTVTVESGGAITVD